MKTYKIWILTGITFILPRIADSAISAESFPKNESDLTFAQLNEINTDGYIPFQNAKIYHQIEIATAALAQEIEELNAQADLEEAQAQNIQSNNTSAPGNEHTQNNTNNNSIQGTEPPSTQTPPPKQHVPKGPSNTTNNNNHTCTVYQPDIPLNQTLPLGHPLLKSDWNEKVSSSWFGFRWNGTDFHHGIDLACCGKKYYGKPVFSPADGTVSWVVRAQPGKSCGNGISIKHANGLRTVYCHLKDAPLYNKGDHVAAGCQIGNVGHTGGRKADKNPSMGIDLSHLHYEIHYNGTAKSITAPDGTTLPITIGAKCRDCIDPTQWLNYHFSN